MIAVPQSRGAIGAVLHARRRFENPPARRLGDPDMLQNPPAKDGGHGHVADADMSGNVLDGGRLRHRAVSRLPRAS